VSHPLASRPRRPAARVAIPHPPPGIRAVAARASLEPARTHPDQRWRSPPPRSRGNRDM